MNMLTFYLAIILFNFVFEAQNYSFYSIPQNVFRIILDNKFVLGSVPSAKAQKKPKNSLVNSEKTYTFAPRKFHDSLDSPAVMLATLFKLTLIIIYRRDDESVNS